MPAKRRGENTTSNGRFIGLFLRRATGVSPFHPPAPLAQDGFPARCRIPVQTLCHTRTSLIITTTALTPASTPYMKLALKLAAQLTPLKPEEAEALKQKRWRRHRCSNTWQMVKKIQALLAVALLRMRRSTVCHRNKPDNRRNNVHARPGLDDSTKHRKPRESDSPGMTDNPAPKSRNILAYGL